MSFLTFHTGFLTLARTYTSSINTFFRDKIHTCCMSQRGLQRRELVIGVRKTKPPHPSPSPRRRTPPRSLKKSKHVTILTRCSSAPALLPVNLDRDGDDGQEFMMEATFLRPKTFLEAFSSSTSLSAFSPQRHSYEGYSKEAKVVVNVTVEGSPGPVRTMVKLGSSVEDTIKLVVDKYSEEGRTPKLDPNVASSFQLHHSSFSLQGLDKSEKIGDVGRRTFFLRTSNGASDLNSETVTDSATQNSATHIPRPPFLLQSWIAQAIGKIVRRVCKLWKILVCL